MSKECTVKINPNTGEMTVEVAGVMGGACTEITEELLRGDEEVEREYTDEHCLAQEVPLFEEDL